MAPRSRNAVPAEADTEADAPNVLVISASMGAGHDGAANELTERLRATGLAVRRLDFLDLLPARLGPLTRYCYHRLLTRAPGLYQRIYSRTEAAATSGPLVRALLRAAERRLPHQLATGTVAVVSTYPAASQVLGSLRRCGLLSVPALTYLTDFSVHPLWIATGIDAHFAAHPIPAAAARARHGAGVMVTGPLVSPRFAPPQDRRAAREHFGLPARTPLALLVAGSWGVGAIRRAASDLRACGVAVPVVVCGRNRSLAARLRRDGMPHVFGWVEDMPRLMHAVDVLVQNAGGLTSLEAFAAGVPVASYLCIPGHGRANAQALHDAGLAVWIRDQASLATTLSELIDGARGAEQRARGLALFDQPGAPISAILRVAHVPTIFVPRPRRASPAELAHHIALAGD